MAEMRKLFFHELLDASPNFDLSRSLHLDGTRTAMLSPLALDRWTASKTLQIPFHYAVK